MAWLVAKQLPDNERGFRHNDFRDLHAEQWRLIYKSVRFGHD